MWLNTLLCSECSVILDWYHSPCLSWDPPNVDDLGRVALLGKGSTIDLSILLSPNHRKKTRCFLLHQPLQLLDGYDLSCPRDNPERSFNWFFVPISPFFSTTSTLQSLIFNLFVFFSQFLLIHVQFPLVLVPLPLLVCRSSSKQVGQSYLPF